MDRRDRWGVEAFTETEDTGKEGVRVKIMSSIGIR